MEKHSVFIVILQLHSLLRKSSVEFSNNNADYGGVFRLRHSFLISSTTNFISNTANYGGIFKNYNL